jgi:tetratricopeptide (TPR) repeat protein
MQSSSPELLNQGLMDLLMQTGDWLLEQGNTSNALSHYAAAHAAWTAIGQPVSKSPLNLADRWSRLGRPKAAEEVYQAMAEGGLPGFALLMLRGWLALSCDRITSAHALFSQAVEEAPAGDREVLRACSEGLALAAYASGDLEGARQCLPAILEDTLDRCMADEMGALFAFPPVEANAPSIARCYTNIAESFFARGFWNQAIVCYRRSLSVDPSSHEAWRSLGDAYLVQGLTFKSEECYRKAIELRPDDARAYHYLGDALLKLRRLDDAIASVERAVEIDPGYIEALAKLQSLRSFRGQRWDELFPDPVLLTEEDMIRDC